MNGKKSLNELAKKYREVQNKIINLESDMKDQTENVREKIEELKEKKENIEEPYKEKIENLEDELDGIIEDINEHHHPGKNKKIDTGYAKLNFQISRSLKINDEEKAIDILRYHNKLNGNVKVYKTPIKELMENGEVDDDVASYEESRYFSATNYLDLDDEEKELFNTLIDMRNKIAEENNTEKYYVFSNETLRWMAKEKPETPREMKNVKGVGSNNFDKYGEPFLKVIQDWT